MLWWRVGGVAAMVCVCAALAAPDAASASKPAPKSARPASKIAKQRDGTLLIAGRSLRCGTNRNVLDRHLPNLGLAAPGVVVFNPRELSQWPDIVRLFVFNHECGHHHVGGNELGADCWAAKQGVREGWLHREGLDQVCRSFGGGPATSTHPSGARRCAALNRCFAAAMAAKQKAGATVEAQAQPPGPAASAPKLLSGPTLERSGMRPVPGEK